LRRLVNHVIVQSKTIYEARVYKSKKEIRNIKKHNNQSGVAIEMMIIKYYYVETQIKHIPD